MPKSISLSPDGKLAAYTRSWIDEKQNKTFANLHILDLTTGETRQWTKENIRIVRPNGRVTEEGSRSFAMKKARTEFIV